jgi:ribosomal protein S27AE
MKRDEVDKLLAAPVARSITCPRCGRTSYNAGDIVNRYCGYCHAFHDELYLLPPIVEDHAVHTVGFEGFDEPTRQPARRAPRWMVWLLVALMLIGIGAIGMVAGV